MDVVGGWGATDRPSETSQVGVEGGGGDGGEENNKQRCRQGGMDSCGKGRHQGTAWGSFGGLGRHKMVPTCTRRRHVSRKPWLQLQETLMLGRGEGRGGETVG